MKLQRLIIGTTNAGKGIEIRSALGAVPGWVLESLPPGTAGIEETGNTFLENAVLKAEHYSSLTPELTLADDSGLCVSALDGRPGVHSARYADKVAARIERLLSEMKTVPDGKRDAVFYCAQAVARSGQVIWTVQEHVVGVIAHSPAGTGGFGYDPVFLLPELGRTMAELDVEERNRLSARGKAVAQLRKFLFAS